MVGEVEARQSVATLQKGRSTGNIVSLVSLAYQVPGTSHMVPPEYQLRLPNSYELRILGDNFE